MVKNVLDKIGTLTTISRVKIKNRPLGASEGAGPSSRRGINLLLAEICPSLKFYEILSDFLHKLKVLVELAPKG